VIGDVVPFQIALRRFNGIVDRLGHFVRGTANVTFVAIPCTPHFTPLSLFDVNRVPNNTPCVIMTMNLFYWHQDLLSVTGNFAQQSSRSNCFTKRMCGLGNMVEDVEGVRISLGLGKINLLGHSYGGVLAQAYALKYQANLNRQRCDRLRFGM
jgi:alpha/beta hydrolase fold